MLTTHSPKRTKRRTATTTKFFSINIPFIFADTIVVTYIVVLNVSKMIGRGEAIENYVQDRSHRTKVPKTLKRSRKTRKSMITNLAQCTLYCDSRYTRGKPMKYFYW
jgi:hypothetical protein